MGKARSANAAGSFRIDTILSGTKWSGDVTFSFQPATNAPAGLSGAEAVDPVMKGAVRSALAMVEGFTNLSVREGGGGGADIRVAQGSAIDPPGALGPIALGAYAFSPGNGAIDGDAFFGRAMLGDLAPGSYGFRSVLHEIGHSLGLKHPSDPGPFGTLAPHLDGPEQSVMSARSMKGAPLTAGLGAEYGGFAQTYMPADIAALQHLYGANYANRSDTVYRFDAGERVMLQTIWDGGGNDTYDFASYTFDLTVSLAPGAASITGQEPQLNRAGEIATGATPVYATGAIHNAHLHERDLRSLIENAAGGRGDDHMTGNVAPNQLIGRLGHDTLFGGHGMDTLIGAPGHDRLFGGEGNDTLRGGHGHDSLYGGHGNDCLFGALGADLLHGADGRDTALGGFGADTINGERGADVLFGEGGDDHLYGGFDADRLLGGTGNDHLFGASGDDTLDAGGGTDRLVGGPGADRFVARAGTTIVDFNRQEGDVVDLAGRLRAVEIEQVGHDTIVRVSTTEPEHYVRLRSVTASQFGPDDFI